jgi:hypothetical protein
MDYLQIYNNIIEHRQQQSPDAPSHSHHIVPRSLGGDDGEDNVVRVTVREHKVLHLCLYKLGFKDQIYSVQLLCLQNKLKQHRWILKAIARQSGRNLRTRNQERMAEAKEHCSRMKIEIL